MTYLATSIITLLHFTSQESAISERRRTKGRKLIRKIRSDALSMIYGSNLASLAADYLIIGRAVLSSQVELKAITAQRLMQVFALVAFNPARCLLSRKITNRELR